MAYKMTHPESDVEIHVNRADVDMYESQGWSTKAKSPSAAATESTDS